MITSVRHLRERSIYYLLSIISILWLASSMVSCRQKTQLNQPNSQDESKSVFIEAMTRNITSFDPEESSPDGGKKDVNTGYESRLRRLRLLAFTPEGKLVCNELKTGLETMTENPIYFIKDKGTPNAQGRYLLNLIYIGNETPSMKAQLDEVANLEQFKKNSHIILADYDYDQSLGLNPEVDDIVMTAFNVGQYSVDVTETHDEANPLNMEVTLTRALAKVEVVVVKDIDKYPMSEYTIIEEISLINVAPKYYIFYNSRYLNEHISLPPFGTSTNPFKTVIKRRGTEASIQHATFYIPPNEVTNNAFSTQLRIKMSSTIAPSRTDTLFFVDTDSQMNQTLSRLNHYKITVVPKGLEKEGIEIHTEVVPWDTKTIHKFIGDFFTIEVADPTFGSDTNTLTIKETIYIESDPTKTTIPHDYEWKIVTKNGVTIDDSTTTEKTINLEPAPSAQPYTLYKNGISLPTGTIYAEVWRRDIKVEPEEEFKLIKKFEVGTSL